MSKKHHPGVYAYASWRGTSIEAAAAELAEAPETDRNRVKWERVGRFVEDMVRAEADATIAQLVEALELIAGTDWADAALDPQRAVRVAQAALKAAKGEA